MKKILVLKIYLMDIFIYTMKILTRFTNKIIKILIFLVKKLEYIIYLYLSMKGIKREILVFMFIPNKQVLLQ